jgi:hypothetical protein
MGRTGRRKGATQVNGTTDQVTELTPTGQRRRAAIPAKRRGEPYVPGAFDRLLAVKDHPAPEMIDSVTIDVTGAVLMLTEHTKDGHHPRHRVDRFPYSIDLVLPSGEQIWLEIRALGPMVEYRTPEQISADLRMPADLLLFIEDEEE